MSELTVRTSATVLLIVATVAGCSGRSSGDATARADGFYDAIGADNGRSACAMIAPKTRSALVQSAGKPCFKAVLETSLSPAGEVEAERAFGTSAQVRYGSDTVFLGRYRDGWLVTAAGCTPRAHQPYDCEIEAG